MNALRRDRVREYLRENGAATIRELSREFPEVSLMTIHRDLDALELEGCVKKIRGGARYIAEAPKSEAAYPIRAVENQPAKEYIAELAASLITPGVSVYIDSGTTGFALAKRLPAASVQVFTDAPNIAMAASEKPEPVVNICGGMLNRRNLALTGKSSLDFFEHVNVDIAFMAASGYTPKSGFTCGSEGEAQIKMRVISRAAKVVMMADSSKFGKVLPFTFASPEDIQILITDALPDEKLADSLRQLGVALMH